MSLAGEIQPPACAGEEISACTPPGKKHARAGAGKREEPGEAACPGGGKGDGAGGITSPDARRGRCSQPLPRGGAAKKVGPPVKASPKRKGCGIKI